MKPAKKIDSITIRIDPDTKAGLELLAASDDRTLSAYVVRLLKSHVDSKQRSAAKGKS